MSKHAEGPWTYEYNNDTGPRDECFYEFYDITAGGKLIGRIETEADARLATAAPDLLEALEDLYALISTARCDIPDAKYATVTNAAVVIARARGEA